MKQTNITSDVITWSKEQIKASSKFKHRHDVLDAVLMADQSYTMADVETKIDDYMKGGVE
ncbi:hypothetical protein [Fusibacter bizertensis]